MVKIVLPCVALGVFCRRSFVRYGGEMTESLEQARAAYLERHRKLKARRNARYRDKQRAKAGKPPAKARHYKPRVSPPPDDVPTRAWPDAEKAQWCDRLLDFISEGGSVSGFVRDHPSGPNRTVFYRWLQEDASLWNRYAHAREVSADTLADDCIAIADEVQDAGQFDSARVNAARLRVDARKWVASKLKPKTYADRIETVQSGSVTVEHRLSDEDRAKVLAMIEARRIAASAPNLVEAQRLIDVTPVKDLKDQPKP